MLLLPLDRYLDRFLKEISGDFEELSALMPEHSTILQVSISPNRLLDPFFLLYPLLASESNKIVCDVRDSHWACLLVGTVR